MSRNKPNHPRRPRRETHPVAEVLRALAGEHIPGGCDHCAAYTKTTGNIDHPTVFMTTVHHDVDCVRLAEMEAGR